MFRLCDLLNRLAQPRFHRVGVGWVDAFTRQDLAIGHYHREEVRTIARAVQVGLVQQWISARERRLELRDRDELALRELLHIVAAVDVDELVRPDLRHDVASLVVAVRVEHRGGDLRLLVVALHHRVRLHEQLTARIRLVGAEVAEFGHIDELPVDDRRTHDLVVHRHAHDFRRAVAVRECDVETALGEFIQVRGHRRGPEGRGHQPAADLTLANVGFDLGWPRFGPAGRELGPVALVNHFADARDQVDERRPDALHIVEQRGEIALRSEVTRATRGQRPECEDAAERVVHRHVVDRDHRACIGCAPCNAAHALAEHGALGRTGAARRVVDRHQWIFRLRRHEHGRGRQGPAPLASGLHRFDPRRHARGREPGAGALIPFALGVVVRAILEHHEARGPVTAEHDLDGVVEALDARREAAGLRVGDDSRERRNRSVRLQRHADRAEVRGRQVCDHVSRAGEAQDADEIAGSHLHVLVVLPYARERAHVGRDLSIGRRLEVVEQLLGAAPGRIRHDRRRTPAQCRAIGVRLHHSGNQLPHAHARSPS